MGDADSLLILRVLCDVCLAASLDMLEKFLHSKGWHWLRLDGNTAAADRPGIVDRFNANYASDSFVSEHNTITQRALRSAGEL